MELAGQSPAGQPPAGQDQPVQGVPALPRFMPALAGGTHGYTHTVHSALVSLRALGVASAQIMLRRAGRDAHTAGTIVRQSPAAGWSLTPGVLVELEVAGLGFTHALPVGMWDSGGEAAAGTREILEPLDDPLEKLKHWFHEGAPLFRLSPDDSGACARWLALFGVRAESWPPVLWYRLASLIADLAQHSCTEEGCAFALGVLLELPVRRFAYHPTLAVLPGSALSALGARSSQLGVDLLLGDAVEDLAAAEIEIGPVSLAIYEHFAEDERGVHLLGQVLELLMPVSTGYDIRWLVEDATQPPRLGIAAANSRLGINTHMGEALAAEPPARNLPVSRDAGASPARADTAWSQP